jgi:hypothetical protein
MPVPTPRYGAAAAPRAGTLRNDDAGDIRRRGFPAGNPHGLLAPRGLIHPPRGGFRNLAGPPRNPL